MPLKRGKYSKEETQFVIDNVYEMSAGEIAAKLGRAIDSVENLIRKRKLKTVATTEDQEDSDRILSLLQNSPHWAKINVAITEQEIPFFVSDWINMKKQFGDEVWYTEEMYMVDILLLNIKKYRTYKLEKDSLQAIENLEKILAEEYALDIELRDIPAIMKAEQELALQKSSLTSHTKSLKDVLEKIEKLMDKLKANREQRRDVKATEETYWGYIEMLQDEKFRKNESRQAELMRLAQNRSRENLYEYHQYIDGELDIPILTPEIAIRKKQEERNELTKTKNRAKNDGSEEDDGAGDEGERGIAEILDSYDPNA